MQMQEVRFGIELETVFRDSGTVARAIQSVVGGEVTHVGGRRSFDPWRVVDDKGRTWNVVADASLTSVPANLRAEVVSPILGYDDIPELQNVIRAVRRSGATTDDCTGTHVHLSHPDITPKALTNLAKLICKQQDLMEEFRQPVIDRLVLSLVNRGVLKPADFEDRGEAGVFLNDSGCKRFFDFYHQTLQAEFIDREYAADGNRVTFRDIFNRQARRMKEAIIGKSDYRPYVFH